MKRTKLFIGLLAAGALTAGLGSSIVPADAQQRVITATLITGQTVSVTVPAGTPCSAGALGTLAAPVASVTCTDTPAPQPPVQIGTTPQPTQPAQPGQTTPTTPTTPTQTPKPAGKGGQQDTTTTKPDKAKTRLGAKRVEDLGAQRQEREAKARTPDGAPTAADPTFSLASPGPAAIGVPNFFIEKFRIPPFLLRIYQAAGIEYGVPWQVLAAINEIETDYGRNLNVSSAGAMGWMQFIPSSWKAYGVDANDDGRKDPYNPVDAIFAAARYLKAAGAKDNIRNAIFSYNHAGWYVDSVMLRAKLIGGLPEALVGAITGLTEGRFPVAARATYADDISAHQALKRAKTGNAANVVESSPTRRGINIFAKPGAPVIAVNDGVIKAVGVSKSLGRYVVLQDVYGNQYTYARLGKIASSYPSPKPKPVSLASIKRELETPQKQSDPRPAQPASAGSQPVKGLKAATKNAPPQKSVRTVEVSKERLFAHPGRSAAYRNGGEQQLLQGGKPVAGYTTFEAYFKQVLGLPRKDVVLKALRPGAQVIGGTVLGRIDKTDRLASHVHFSIRPAGKKSPNIDPKPILDGWKLLEATAIYRAAGKNPFFGPDARNPTIGQIMLMSKEQLQQQVLSDPRIEIYDGGRRDIISGQIDRRVLATLKFLTSAGLKPTVSCLKSGHSFLTTAGGVSEHSSGNAVDIAAINGIPILGHQGAGSITDITIRRLLTLQGTMKPHQIISLMTFKDADNTLSLSDHDDHIHVGFYPQYAGKLAGQYNAQLKPGQWIKLIDRLNEIDNPVVSAKPSKVSIPVGRTSRAHAGE
jgi:Transglycosylase SLT domain/Peptidase family M23